MTTSGTVKINDRVGGTYLGAEYSGILKSFACGCHGTFVTIKTDAPMADFFGKSCDSIGFYLGDDNYTMELVESRDAVSVSEYHGCTFAAG